MDTQHATEGVRSSIVNFVDANISCFSSCYARLCHRHSLPGTILRRLHMQAPLLCSHRIWSKLQDRVGHARAWARARARMKHGGALALDLVCHSSMVV